MSEIYWITRLGALGSILDVLSILGIVCLVFIVLCSPVLAIIMYDDLSQATRHRILRYARWLLITWLVAVAGSLFVPSQKEMLLIYGLGSMVDYVQDSDKCKELPDKAAEALTRYLDEVSKDGKEE